MMRTLLGVFALLSGTTVLAIVARFGFVTADTTADGILAGGLFAIVAAGGLGGHAVAVRVWAQNRSWSVAIGLVSALALIVNMSNSLGAIAGRSDARTAERARDAEAVKDLRAEFERVSRERDALGAVKGVSSLVVDAAKGEVDVVLKRLEAGQCSRRSTAVCRDLLSEEKERRSELTRVTAEFALAARAEALDQRLASLQDELVRSKRVEEINPQASALVLLFGLGQSSAASVMNYQYLALSIVIELLIVMALVGFELLAPPAVPGDAPAPRSAQEKPAGDVGAYALAWLSPCPSAALPLESVLAGYARWCDAHGASRLSDADVETWFATVGTTVGLCIEESDRGLVVRNVALQAAA